MISGRDVSSGRFQNRGERHQMVGSMWSHRIRGVAVVTAAAFALLVTGCGSSTSSSSSATTAASSSGSASANTASSPSTASSSGQSSSSGSKHWTIAYMSYAVANAYDAAMLAAAQQVAKSENATIKVFDAMNSSTTQYSQLQDVISSGQYKAIIVQPIFGAQLDPLIKQAIAKGIKVENLDQIGGPNFKTQKPQVPGEVGAVGFVPYVSGIEGAQLSVKACVAHHDNPCNVGYLYDVKSSALDEAEMQGFQSVIKATKSPKVKIVATGQTMFSNTTALAQVQDMIQSAPDMDVIWGSDQGAEGAVQALAEAGKTGKIQVIGGGGGSIAMADVKKGVLFGEVYENPAREGQLATQQLLANLNHGTTFPNGVNVAITFPDRGEVTQANVNEFKATYTG